VPEPSRKVQILCPELPTNLLLVNRCSPGDVLMLTAAVRDLHAAYPQRYVTAIETLCPDLWLHNPYVMPAALESQGLVHIDCHHPPLLNRCNGQPRHYIEAVCDLLSERLGREIPLQRFAPDIHLAPWEKEGPPKGARPPYWVVVAGGKHDVTIKWWPRHFFQEVIDHFAGRIRFVQVGNADDHHPVLEGAINLVGQTTLRELVQLVYHAEGVVCPVTCTMHMAAAFDKPCVVIAGGREPPHWEMYPGHQFLHTVGQIDCCRRHGCWKARIQPIGDGDEERDGNLCLHPTSVDGEPVARCMAMIEPIDVCRAIERYRMGAEAWQEPSRP